MVSCCINLVFTSDKAHSNIRAGTGRGPELGTGTEKEAMMSNSRYVQSGGKKLLGNVIALNFIRGFQEKKIFYFLINQ